MLGKMITLQVSHKNVNGPLMIADVAGQAIQVGFTSYLYFLALISISLGVMNLLPIPMLDGGHLASYVVEVFAGKRIAQKAFIAVQPFGLVMLAGLMSLAFYNDILKIFN
jgi:regulator of sigma E protease